MTQDGRSRATRQSRPFCGQPDRPRARPIARRKKTNESTEQFGQWVVCDDRPVTSDAWCYGKDNLRIPRALDEGEN
jgi:hypothetical protein